MSTFTHQYIAKLIFSQKQIDEVINVGKNVKVNDQDITKVKPTNYDDTNITEEYITAKDGSYDGYLLEISDPLRVKLAMTAFIDKTGQNTSDMAKAHDAVAAINGGGFADLSWAGTGAEPSDFVIIDGKVAFKDKNLNENQKCNVIGLNAQGALVVGNYSLNGLLKLDVKVMSAVTLDTYVPLVVNKVPTYKNSEQCSSYGFHPRTVIGQKQDGTILMLVLDGRRVRNGVLMKGASLYDAQKIMTEHGAIFVANLDGGNSTTMYYNGAVINNPSGELGERPTATSFYVEN
jgi:exopolysaccharide biosynthesis protein